MNWSDLEKGDVLMPAPGCRWRGPYLILRVLDDANQLMVFSLETGGAVEVEVEPNEEFNHLYVLMPREGK